MQKTLETCSASFEKWWNSPSEVLDVRLEQNYIGHIISYHHIKLYFIHQNKSIKHNMILRTWSKGQKGQRQSCPSKGFNKYTETCKIIHFTHIQTKIHKNTQDMPQNEINCIQIIKLISADFRFQNIGVKDVYPTPTPTLTITLINSNSSLALILTLTQ